MEENESNIDKTEKSDEDKFWIRKIQEYWQIFALMVIGGVTAVVGMILVLIWHMESSFVGNFGDALIGDWTLAWIWVFFLVLILWELLFVGVPVAVACGLGYYFWWQRLPLEEREEFKSRQKEDEKSRKGAGGGFGFFMFIAYSLYMYVQGYFFTPFGNFAYTFWIYHFFMLIVWMLIVLGIPAAIILVIVYFKVWRNK